MPLSACAEFINGRAFKPADFTSSGLPVIRIKQLLDRAAEPDRYAGDFDDKHLLRNGDLVFSWSATLAVLRWDRGPGLLNQHLFRVVERDGIDRMWLTYALQASLPALEDLTHGTTMKHITKKTLDEYTIRVPPRIEQRREADLIERIDATVVAAEAHVAALTNLLEPLRHELVALAPEPVELHTLVDKNGIQIGPFGSQLHAADYVDDGIPVVMPRDMNEGRIDTKQIARVTERDAARLARHALQFGDILLPRRGDLSKRARVRSEETGWLCGTGSIRIRIPAPHARGVFESMATPATTQWLINHAVGTTMLNLNTEIVGRIPVAVPPPSESLPIIAAIDEVESGRGAALKHLRSLTSLKAALLQALLSGTLSIPASYDRFLTVSKDASAEEPALVSV
jgi:type I restriction enzyme, S subunit